MANYEDDVRDTNYFRQLPDYNRGGGGNNDGSLNTPELIDRIKKVMLQGEEERKAQDAS
jgi:hypothetical protein